MSIRTAGPALRQEAAWLAKAAFAWTAWSLALVLPLGRRPLVGVPLAGLALVGFLWYNLRRRAGTRWDPPRRRLPWAVWRLLAVLAIGLVPWFLATQTLYSSLRGPLPVDGPDFLHFAHKSVGGLTAAYILIVVMPLLEEFGFRGWLQASLQQRLGPALAIPIASAMWAIAHGTAVFVPVFLLGLVIGSVMWITGSVWPCFLIHALHNAMAVIPDSIGSGASRALEPLLGPGAGPARQAISLVVLTIALGVLLAPIVRLCRAIPAEPHVRPELPSRLDRANAPPAQA